MIVNPVRYGSGSTKFFMDLCPEATEIRKSWLPIELDADSTTGEEWDVAVGDKQIRADTFMGAMISSQDDFVILPIIMRTDGTYFSSEFSAPLANGAGQCALTDFQIACTGNNVESIALTVQDTFDLSDPTSNLLYDPILYIRPNPT